jgi:hypothetical protein
MKKWVFPFILVFLFVSTAVADEPVENINLVLPNNPWISVKDCSSPDDFELKISWTVDPMTCDDSTLEADVFLASTDSCSSAAVEIGNSEENGGDIDISILGGEYSYPETGEELYLSDINGLDCNETYQNKYYFCVKWVCEYTTYDYLGNPTENSVTYKGGTELRFDTQPPDPPFNVSVSAGESNLRVYWEHDDSGGDVIGYRVYYQLQGSDQEHSEGVSGKDTKYELIEGLENGQTYEVSVIAIDEAENDGPRSETVTGTPVPSADFYEYYRGSGGSDQGGFCFVATAAFGSYQASMVKPLRNFRDNVLAGSELGRSFINGYYRYGPRWARAIRNSDSHRTMARWALAPAVLVATASQKMSLLEWSLLIIGALMVFFIVRMMIKRKRKLLGSSLVLLAVGLFLLPSMAAAVEKEPNMQLQIRLGSYYPSVDSEDTLTGTPFATTYGSSGELLFEIGMDYEVWRGFGTVTTGASFGFVQYIGKARIQQNGEISSSASNDTTVFNLVPLRLTIGYHFDLLVKYNIPLVPYVSGGLSYYVWWILDGVGDIAKWIDENDQESSAQGGIFGLHFAAGLKLLLDVLDQESATNLMNEVGIINTFLFAEYNVSYVNGFDSGEHMDVGDEAFMFGLMFEF